MGDGSYDAEVAAEIQGLAKEIRLTLKQNYVGDIFWTARNGTKTKLKDLSLQRLKSIKSYLERTCSFKDNEIWLKFIKNEIKNRF